MTTLSSSIEYLEVSSSYRNRKLYPEPGNFIIEISQKGIDNRFTAQDPVCNSAPLIVWSPFAIDINDIVAPYVSPFQVGNISADKNIVIQMPSNTLGSNIREYGNGLVIEFYTGTFFKRARIAKWIYLCSYLGKDFVELILDEKVDLPAGVVNYIIRDPTDTNDPLKPIFFIPTGVSASNYYISYYIYNQTQDEWLPITFYGGTTNIAQCDSTQPGYKKYTPGAWSVFDIYILRLDIPTTKGQVVNVISPTQIQLAANSSNVNEYYTGSFFRKTGTNRDPNSVRIVAYDATNQVITLQEPYTVIVGDSYEILPFTRDNINPFQFSGPFIKPTGKCYDVKLVNLTVPNSLITTGYGSRAIFYPYLYVEFRPVSQPQRSGPVAINSNNPNARGAMFRVAINDSTNLATSPFIRLEGKDTAQRISVSPTDSFRFTVKLPNGDVFSTIEQSGYFSSPAVSPTFYSAATSWVSPLYPNPLNEISALFAFIYVGEGSCDNRT